MTYIKIENTSEKEEVTFFPLKMISLVLLAIGILLFNLMLLSDTTSHINQTDVVDNNIPTTYQEFVIEP